MAAANLYTELKGWQTAIGAGFGFVALICGALFNFHLNRRRDAFLRSEEVRAVSSALYGEILLLREEVAKIARIIAAKHQRGSEIDSQFVADYRPGDPILYPKLADRLGILPPEIVLAITRFHSDYQQARQGLELMVDKDRGFRYSVATFLRPAKDAVIAVRPALRQIEALARIAPPADDPNSGDASEVLEMEILSWEN